MTICYSKRTWGLLRSNKLALLATLAITVAFGVLTSAWAEGEATTTNSDPSAYNQSGRQMPSLKVGMLLSLSGGLEQWCGYFKDGVELAIAEGGTPQIEVVYEDDRSVERKAIAAGAKKLTSIDQVDILATWTASSLPTLKPIVMGAQVPTVIGAYDQSVGAAKPWVFGAFVNYDLLPREIARQFVKEHGVTRLGLVMSADHWSQSFEAPFRDELAKLGATLEVVELVAPTETELRPVIERLKARKVQGVLAPLYGNSQYAFLKQRQDVRFDGLVHVGDGMFEEDLKIAGASAEGVYTSQIWIESDALAEKLKGSNPHGLNPLQLGLVATGYDLIKHIQGAAAQSFQGASGFNNEALRAALESYRSNGLTGPLHLGAAPPSSGEITMIVKNGRFQKVRH